jgi:GntR family phosphonate transport system transcriptional regulator
VTQRRTVASISAQLEAEFGELPAGTRLPSEQTLAERFDIGRGAARGIVDGFQRRGLIRRAASAGTYWLGSREITIAPNSIPSFGAAVRKRGDRPGYQLLANQSRRAAKLEQDYLGLGAGSTLWVVRRLFEVNGEPVGFASSVLPHAPLPALDRSLEDVGSVYQTLGGRYGLTVRRGWQRIRRVQPPPAIRDAMRLTEDHDDIWLVQSLNETTAGQPIEYARTYIRADYQRRLMVPA